MTVHHRLGVGVRSAWALAAAVIVISVVAGGYGVFRWGAERIRRETCQELAAVAELKAGQIAQWRREMRDQASKTAESRFRARAVQSWPMPGSPWVMVAKTDASETLAEWRVRWGVVAAFVVLIVLLAAAVVAALRRHRQARLFLALYESERDTRLALDLRHESDEIRRLLTENAVDMISRHAADGTILYVSPSCERLTGYTAAELVGRAAEFLTCADDRTLIWDTIHGRPKDEDHYRVEHRLPRKDGSVIWVETVGRLIRDDAGCLKEIQCVVRDVTTRKAVEVSNLMLAYLGQIPGRREPIPLAEACRRTLPMLQAEMPKNLELDCHLPSPGPVVRANLNQVQQALTNLVTNAWEAVGNGPGAIHLTVKTAAPADIASSRRFPSDWQTPSGACACLEVADTGCGIADGDIERLFDPFYSTKFSGRGMGLSVVLGVVRAHDGAITVESVPGAGSTFRLYVPVTAEALPPLPEKAAAAPDPPEGDTVLVVEDEDMVRKLAVAMLTRLGFTVLQARDGIEAIDVLRHHAADVQCVLCDLTMPRMDGWETVSALRQIVPGIPVVLASGYSEVDVMDGAHLERPQAFLSKPYRRDELREAIHQARNVKVQK